LIIVDLDKNCVNLPTGVELIDFPEQELVLLRKDLENIDFDIVETNKIGTPAKMNLKSSEYFEHKLVQELNSSVSDAFIEFYVRIFG
jgi:hypothetical protein